MADSVTRSYFPSQVVSDLEKISYDYGMKVAKAIESEWFDDTYSNQRYQSNELNFHRLRLYARGEQSIQKYKDELSINGDLSYLNLDWKPVPIIPKFVDIVVNGIAERTYDVKAYSQDPAGVKKRTEYMDAILADMRTKELTDFTEEAFGVNLKSFDEAELPENEDELALHMQLEYKQAVEIAEEQAINLLFDGNRYELIKKQFYYDLTVLGIGAVKTDFNTSEGVKIKYVDPANLVYSYTESPYFEDIYYVGEAKVIPINELMKEFPHLTQEDLEEIASTATQNLGEYNRGTNSNNDYDNNQVTVLYFNYKTYMNQVYKVKETGSGGDKAIERDDTFEGPQGEDANFSRLQRSIEVLYEGAKIVGLEKLLKWELSKNMMRPKSDYTKVKMNYSIVAPRMYNGNIESLVSRITGFADMIQLTHLKLQQVMSRMVPDGVYLDADGLAEVDLGNGTNYNAQEALNMFFQTGSVIGRSMTADGDQNPGRVPIQELQSGNGGGKMQSLIGTYNYYLQMIRDTTGLNEARDGSTPDKNALVGVQKLAAANSNTATRHILQAGLFLTAETAEALSLRISDVLEYSPTKDAFIQALGAHNVATLEEMSELHLYDFGIFIELAPDEEEKAMLENNIQVALSQGNIDLEDAIDLREIRNVKLANQMLKVRRSKKLARDQQMQQQNIQAQAQANAQAQQVAAQAEMQKNQVQMQSDAQMEQLKSQLKLQELQADVLAKKELMMLEYELTKDLRSKEQALKNQGIKTAKKFESSGNDVLGGINLGGFEPR
jgi:hypothetical protein